ncbi:MAG: hypothetical protein EB015_13155, partial [Methylocystaceae bacterium]|nr:hypothetical protein [Methylocystaceae bacterium]
MRKLFIDLNKHAQKVSRARQLLLDDREPLALAIRKTIGADLNLKPTGATEHGLPIGADGEFQTRLPLELVDWHGEQRANRQRRGDEPGQRTEREHGEQRARCQHRKVPGLQPE